MRVKYLAQPVRARDGRPAWIREVRVDDELAVAKFVQGLSPSSRYFRFMMGMRELSEDALRRFTRPVTGREGVLVVTPGVSLARIVGLGQFVMDGNGEDCEVALVIDDAWQRQGLGGRLLSELSGYAARVGAARIHADVLADNHAMRRLAEKAGYATHTHATAPFVLRLSSRLPQVDRKFLPGREIPQSIVNL